MEERIFKKVMGPTAGFLFFLWILPDFTSKIAVGLGLILLSVLLSVLLLWCEPRGYLQLKKNKPPVAEFKRRMDRY